MTTNELSLWCGHFNYRSYLLEGGSRQTSSIDSICNQTVNVHRGSDIIGAPKANTFFDHSHLHSAVPVVSPRSIKFFTQRSSITVLGSGRVLLIFWSLGHVLATATMTHDLPKLMSDQIYEMRTRGSCREKKERRVVIAELKSAEEACN